MKRAWDVLLVVLAAPLWIPAVIGLALIVRLKLGGPVFFIHERAGRYGRPFRLVKLRSMTQERDVSGRPVHDRDRLTPFGRWLRSTSLDELPELWNVLRGDMSLVGPRPLLMEYLPLYTTEQARRHEVRPGITGWAQVNGRNAIGWDEKFKLDLWYVDNQSLWLDLRILCLTMVRVFQRRGIASHGEVTMTKFTGNAH